MANTYAIPGTQILPAGVASHRAYRLTSIDMLRGLVIVMMAIDHVRDFFLAGTDGDPAAHANITAGLFATRWITHFCAPVFVLLAGVSAGLMASRKSRSDLMRFLFTRGVWLVFVELTVVATGWTFAPEGIAQLGGLIVVPMQVIWAIGAGMVVLSAAQWLGRRACFWLGGVIAVSHNLLDSIWPHTQQLDQQWPAWVALHSQIAVHVGPVLFLFIYPVLPWIGVMLLGFGISEIFELPPARRDAILLRAGSALTLGFVVLRAAGIYGDPNPWHVQPGGATATVIDFLNVTKYPPSLLFLIMTLGPAAVFCSFADRYEGWIKDTLVMFGRVPFAFYVAHIYLIHLLSELWGQIQGFHLRQMLTLFLFYPKGYGVGLLGVYAVWILVVASLYPVCRWADAVKARRRDWWLSYL